MAPNLKNGVNPLTWNVPISNKDGTPTNEFMRKWLQQQTSNSSVPDLTTAAAVSARLDLLGTLPGMLLERGATAWGGLASPADATKFLNGAALPAYAAVKDSDLALTDITTNNVSITAHGFAPKAPNDATKFLNGTGSYSVPAGSVSSAAASIQDDGTNLYVALSDADGQLILDGSGDPVFVAEVLPRTALPPLEVDILVRPSASAAAVTGDNTTYQLLFGTVIKNVGGAWNPATSVFTAPSAGLYVFICSSLLTNINASTHNDTNIQAIGSVIGTVYSAIQCGTVLANSSGQLGQEGTFQLSLALHETVTFNAQVSGSVKDVGVFGAATPQLFTYLSGYKVLGS